MVALHWLSTIESRQAAYAVEQMLPTGIERDDAGSVSEADVDLALRKVDAVLNAAAPDRKEALQAAQERTFELKALFQRHPGARLVYIARPLFELDAKLRAAAIEIDFSFGNADGEVSRRDLDEARLRYEQVRGPVGWNRLLVTDELERRLYPEHTLHQVLGLRLVPRDWEAPGQDGVDKLARFLPYLEDQALARTYADVAARLGVSDSARDKARFQAALVRLGQEITDRGSVRPSITDIARIGCEDPSLKRALGTPIDMARRLQPRELITPFLSPATAS